MDHVSLRIVNWNIGLRGIRRMQDQDDGLQAVFRRFNYPTILLLQETKAQRSDITPDIAFINVDGHSYASYFSFNRDGRMSGGYSGVAIYVSS